MSFLDRFRGTRELEDEVLRLRREILKLERGGPRQREAPGSMALLEVARALRDASSIEGFASAVLAALVRSTGAIRAALILPDDEGNLAALAARDASGELAPATFPFSRDIAAEAAREGFAVATGRAAHDPRFRASQSVKSYGIQSVVCLPVKRRGEPHGCLTIDAGEKGVVRADAGELLAFAELVSLGLDRLDTEAEAARRARLEALGLAASSIAHDLKLPLAGADLALENATTDPLRATESLRLARTALEIAQGLASFARGTERTLAVAPVPLVAVLDEHQREIKPFLAGAKYEVESVLGWEGEVLADRSALLRVLGNLAKNALEAMPDGGKLRYRTADLGEGRVEIIVVDSGPGIAPERLRRLFRPFETFGKKGGCGLGLALARDLARAMRGDLRAESTPGQGSAFHVILRKPDR